VLGRFKRVYSLKDVYDAASSLEYDFIRSDQTFAVRSERHGIHEFTSIDIAATVGQSVIDSYKSRKGLRLRVNLDNPDVVIAADLIYDELFVSIDTTGQSLHIREWRRYNHPGALKPSLSYALVLMSGWRADRLLDPFTGGATIPIEAALRWMNKPVHENKNYQYRKLSLYDPAEEKKEMEDHPDPISEPVVAGSIKGIEISPKHIRGALKNVREAGAERVVSLELADSTRWVPNQKYPYLVTNPPYGIRSGRKKYVVRLYERFARHARKLLEGNRGFGSHNHGT
jgi:tRNA (guanine6-N2)-methyltransferase